MNLKEVYYYPCQFRDDKLEFIFEDDYFVYISLNDILELINGEYKIKHKHINDEFICGLNADSTLSCFLYDLNKKKYILVTVNIEEIVEEKRKLKEHDEYMYHNSIELSEKIIESW